MTWLANLAGIARAALAVGPDRVPAGVATIGIFRGTRQDVYNILWSVVFGFATLNILSLASRRVEPGRRGLSFGEAMAVGVVLLSIVLLGWELLGLFHIFPLKLRG